METTKTTNEETTMPLSVINAAIARKVSAVCEHTSQGRIYFVRGADGRPASRGFSTAHAFARFIRANYPVMTVTP